jgi:predicted Rossmann fold flavoprotein
VQNYPRGEKALQGAFSRFQATDTVKWFANQGVKLKTEADGRMFPTTDSSETIIDCLTKAADLAGVELLTGKTVVSVVKQTTGFEIELKTGEKIKCDRILLATGSNPLGYQIAEDLGHTIEPPVPSLFTFNILDKYLKELAGISANPVQLKLSIAKKTLEQTAPLLITHWGLSGPAVLKLSAWGARVLHDCKYQATLLINWQPKYSSDQLRSQLLSAKTAHPKKVIALQRGVDLPHRLWQYLIARTGIGLEQRWAEVSNKSLNQIIQELTQGAYQIKGKGAFKEEFVTCGGVNLKQVNFKTMASRITPGLHFAGEVLDIDGVTGGFNFQSAWTTAWIAGNALGNIES